MTDDIKKVFTHLLRSPSERTFFSGPLLIALSIIYLADRIYTGLNDAARDISGNFCRIR